MLVSTSAFRESPPRRAVSRENHVASMKRDAEYIAAAFPALEIVGLGGLEFAVRRGADAYGRHRACAVLLDSDVEAELGVREHSMGMSHSEWVRRQV